MIASVFFIFNRLVEIVFLIPIIGMLVCPRPILYIPPQPSMSSSLQVSLLTIQPGLLRQWLHQSKHADPLLHPGPLHRQHNRHLLGPRYPNPPLNNKALRNLRRLHRPLLLRRFRRRSLPAPLHRKRRLRKLARRLRLDLTGPIRLLRPTNR